MADALNIEFTQNPRRFFKRNLVILSDVFPTTDGYTGSPQLSFSLRPHPTLQGVRRRRMRKDKSINVVELCQQEASDTSPITGFWLPYHERFITRLDLSGNGGFFFTATLSGCRIVKSDQRSPKLLHVPGGTAQQSENTTAQLYMGNVSRRRFSERNGYPVNRHFRSAIEPDYLVFYGIRRNNASWRFYKQGYDDLGNLDHGNHTVRRLFTNKRVW